jgi:hypothetical protein
MQAFGGKSGNYKELADVAACRIRNVLLTAFRHAEMS